MSAAAVVFDLDGTLLDSMPLVLRAYAFALEPYHPPISDNVMRARMGGPPEKIFRQLLNDSAHVTGALRRLEGFGAENWPLIEAFPGMRDLLRDLHGAAVKLAVWTGRERESTEWLLRHHRIGEFLDTYVCGDDLASHKPDPAGLDETLRQLGVERDDTIFVGDAEVDLLAGDALGIRTLLINHGHPVATSLSAKAWRLAATPEAAYAAIRVELIHPSDAPGAHHSD